jgi:hypothetical protein
LGLRFFGLTPNDKEIYLEPTFSLMYYMGFTYTECMKLPVWKRKWFIERMVREMERAGGKNSRAAHANDAQTRALSGYHREAPPAKLRRFT